MKNKQYKCLIEEINIQPIYALDNESIKQKNMITSTQQNPPLKGDQGGCIKYNPNLKDISRKLRKESTLSEVLLWKHLKAKQMKGYSFLRQKPIENFVVDFYSKELKLVIEIDGDSHIGKEEADIERQNIIENLGISFLRFSDLEIKKNLNGILKKISNWISQNTSKEGKISL